MCWQWHRSARSHRQPEVVLSHSQKQGEEHYFSIKINIQIASRESDWENERLTYGKDAIHQNTTGPGPLSRYTELS